MRLVTAWDLDGCQQCGLARPMQRYAATLYTCAGRRKVLLCGTHFLSINGSGHSLVEGSVAKPLAQTLRLHDVLSPCAYCVGFDSGPRA